MGIDSRTPLPQEITTLIAKKARQVVKKYRFRELDAEDIEQMITLAVIRKRAAVDASQAQQMGFLICLVDHAIADIVAACRAGNRDFQREGGSLDQWVKDGDGDWVRGKEVITEDDAGRYVGLPAVNEVEGRDLAIDLAAAVSSLPPRLRRVFDCYVELGSSYAVAKALGLHRSTVLDAIQQIKAHFRDAGLEEYLKKSRRSNPALSPSRWLLMGESPI